MYTSMIIKWFIRQDHQSLEEAIDAAKEMAENTKSDLTVIVLDQETGQIIFAVDGTVKENYL